MRQHLIQSRKHEPRREVLKYFNEDLSANEDSLHSPFAYCAEVLKPVGPPEILLPWSSGQLAI